MWTEDEGLRMKHRKTLRVAGFEFKDCYTLRLTMKKRTEDEGLRL
jgi:hypothetical protein